MSTTTAPPLALPAAGTRWLQLLLGLVCMMAISSPQYVWTLFTKPLGSALGASASAIQVTFSILIVLQTFFSPFQGWLVERFGPRFSVFASTLSDTFGAANATKNYGCLYIAQGIGAIFGGPLAAMLREQTGSWLPVFAIVIALDALTGILALALLKPMRHGYATRK